MNNNRRREIRKVIKSLDNIKSMIKNNGCDDKIRRMIDDCCSDLMSIQMDEQDSFDNMPESLQYSERGDRMQENIDNLDECMDMIDGIENETDLDEINDIIDSIIEELNDIIL